MPRATIRMFLTVLTVLMTFITCGCSGLISRSGVSGPGALSNYKTRTEVNDQFGKPDDTRTCSDGRVVENRWVRRQTGLVLADNRPQSEPFQFMYDSALIFAYAATLGLVDIFVVPVAAYESEKAKLHYAFVYDEADQLLYLYDLSASPPAQFEETTRSLSSLLTSQLENEKCSSWTATLTDYVQEVRRRAACIGYTFSVDEEQAFERMLAIGAGVDSGRVPREDGLVEIREPLGLRLYQ